MEGFDRLRDVGQDYVAEQQAQQAIAEFGGMISTFRKRPNPPMLGVYFAGVENADAGLALLGPLVELENVTLRDTVVSRPALNGLSEIPKLKRIALFNVCIEAEGRLAENQ